jgi:uncharacterized cupin superfamily protein
VKNTAVPEATIEEREHGKVVTSEGWFVLNLSEGEARTNPNSGTFLSFEQRETPWQGTGVNVRILEPGQPACRYHQETGQEDFVVLAGECILIVEEQERHLRQWDFVHCPGGTRHVFVGAGIGPCAILMIGDRPEPEELHYPVSAAAARHGEASVTVATDDPEQAYADWPGRWEPTRSPWPLA